MKIKTGLYSVCSGVFTWIAPELCVNDLEGWTLNNWSSLSFESEYIQTVAGCKYLILVTWTAVKIFLCNIKYCNDQFSGGEYPEVLSSQSLRTRDRTKSRLWVCFINQTGRRDWPVLPVWLLRWRRERSAKLLANSNIACPTQHCTLPPADRLEGHLSPDMPRISSTSPSPCPY